MAVILNLTGLDWVGIFGSFLIAGACLAVTRGWVDAARAPFNLANFAGSLSILLSLYHRPNAGAIMIELLWALIAATALVRVVRGHRG